MKEICFNEINKLLNQKKELIKNASNNQNLDKIRDESDNNIKEKLSKLDEKNIESLFKNKSLSELTKINYKNNNKNFYYKNAILINKTTLEIIKELGKFLINKIISSKCVFDKGEIIMFIQDTPEIINVGNINDNEELIIKFIINTDNNPLLLSDSSLILSKFRLLLAFLITNSFF